MVFTFLEKSKIAYVYFGKRPTEKKEGEKLSALEPKVCNVYLHKKLYLSTSLGCEYSI